MVADGSDRSLDPALAGLEPRALWEQFDALSRIPRLSHNEAGVRSYLRGLAHEKGWDLREDGGGNLVLVVPGRGAGEQSSPVAIQGHMDMVGAKDPDSPHDFDRDPIKLRRAELDDGGRLRDVLMATGTTLGSDNGIGCAAGLAVALTPGLEHPPLELVFTANEETGMTGAENLDPGIVLSRTMLNLDTEEWGSVYISCAGGRDLVARWSLEREAPQAGELCLRVRVRGLRGGHSGVDIHHGRTNAVKLLVSLVLDPQVDLDGVRLGGCRGGARPNAIPRDADLVLWCPPSRAAELQRTLEAAASDQLQRIAGVDPEATVTVSPCDAEETRAWGPIAGSTGRAAVKAIANLDDGVIGWSTHIEGLVETSSNLGVIDTTEDELRIVIMTRSSRDDMVASVQDRMTRTLEASGAEVEYSAAYPGWQADPESKLLQRTREVYQRLFGAPAEIKAIHAGLECGILGQRLRGVSMVSFGPEIRNAHTPEETLVLDTVPPFFALVVELLRDLCD